VHAAPNALIADDQKPVEMVGVVLTKHEVSKVAVVGD
jgi:hypothetical protein